jgi:hypothetical protein
MLVVIAFLVAAFILQTDCWRPIVAGRRFSAEDIAAALRGAGCNVEQLGEPTYSEIFGADRLNLSVDGTPVQVYCYPKSITVQIGGGGSSVNGAQVEWIIPPHYLRYSNVLVVVLTSDYAEWRKIDWALSGLR